MTDERPIHPHFLTGLSGRLLVLTVCFVMLAQVLIYVPSVSQFRREYLEDKIAKAYLAGLALEASPNNAVTHPLAMDLLLHAGAHAIVLKMADRRMLLLSNEPPPTPDATFDLRETSALDWLADAFVTLSQSGNRILRLVDVAPREPGTEVEVLLDETPLRREMYRFSRRIMTLSVVFSAISAILVYLVLRWWMVQPILRLTASIERFRRTPEDESTTIRPSRRSDEIGTAERELAAMQHQVRSALRQKTRLALLGGAVAKIHHDLRNSLASAMLASDRLADSDDPVVRLVTPRLFQAIDRAVALTTRTLDYLRAEPAPRTDSEFPLRALLIEAGEAMPATEPEAMPLIDTDGTDRDLRVRGDREQLFRVFSNLLMNAAQAGARRVRIIGWQTDGRTIIDVSDDGGGIPAALRERLFQPFASTRSHGGTGLGLVIAREILAAHGGSIALVETGDAGTTFRIELPASPARRAVA
jgi:signal transduction histidine kinase